MKDLVRQINNLPLIIKLILCIPVLEIIYGVFRVINGLAKNDVLWIILGVLTIVPGAAFMWLIDLIWVLLKGHAFLLGDAYLD